MQTAIVIVGRDLRIRRFSPMAEKMLKLIPAGVGRPIGDRPGPRGFAVARPTRTVSL